MRCLMTLHNHAIVLQFTTRHSGSRREGCLELEANLGYKVRPGLMKKKKQINKQNTNKEKNKKQILLVL